MIMYIIDVGKIRCIEIKKKGTYENVLTKQLKEILMWKVMRNIYKMQEKVVERSVKMIGVYVKYI